MVSSILPKNERWDNFQYRSNQITKKEPKSDYRLSKFDWHDLSPIFLAITLLHDLKIFRNQSNIISRCLFGSQLSNCYSTYTFGSFSKVCWLGLECFLLRFDWKISTTYLAMILKVLVGGRQTKMPFATQTNTIRLCLLQPQWQQIPFKIFVRVGNETTYSALPIICTLRLSTQLLT